jgi:hypothetical protein
MCLRACEREHTEHFAQPLISVVTKLLPASFGKPPYDIMFQDALSCSKMRTVL